MKCVELEREDGGVLTIFLARPEQRNAFTSLMAEELKQCFEMADGDSAVKVVILSARGSTGVFCAGADLQGGEEYEKSEEEKREDDRRGYPMDLAGKVTLAMLHCRKPIIAAMNGSGVGVGITMPLAADIRVVNSSAKIGFVFARRGLVPEGVSTYLLPRLVGYGQAMEWVLTGKVFRASEAASTGLFTRIVPEVSDVLPLARKMAHDMIRNMAPVALALSKELLARNPSSPLDASHAESRALASCFGGEEVTEGFMSFLEKRKPQWSTNSNDHVPAGWFPRPKL